MKKRLFTMVAIAGAAFVCAPQIHAAATTLLVLNDGLGDTVSIDQNGTVTGTGTFTDTASSGSGPHGTITFIGSVGTFDFNVTTGRGGGVEVLPALMNLNSIDAKNTGGAGQLTLTFSDTSYSDLASTLNLSSSTTFTAGTPLGSAITFTGFASAANAIPAATLIGALGPFTQTSNTGATSLAGTQNFANPIGASGSLTEMAVLSFNGAGEIDSGFTIANVAVPEPTGVVLLGTMVLGLAGLMRKKQVKRS
jgi:hypothetical protein